MSWCERIISTIWSPILCTGLSADSGSWKIIAIRLPRTPLDQLRRRADQLAAADLRRTLDDRADFGSRPIAAEERHRLARAASPTTPTISPASTSRSTPRTACTSPDSVGNVTWKSRARRTAGRSATWSGLGRRSVRASGRRRWSTSHRPAAFGSKASRSPSPTKLMQRSSRRATAHGNTTSHQLPGRTSAFELADAGGPSDVRPSPGLRAVAEERQRRLGDDGADDRQRQGDQDRADRVGQQVPNDDPRSDAPSDRDASTNSRSFSDSTSPRTMRATAIQPTADEQDDHEPDRRLVAR